MQTENDTSKHEDSLKQETGEGCSGASCSECSQEWYDGADSECIKGSKCGFRKRGASIAEVARNVSDVQRRIMDNDEIQDALKRLRFVIGAEMGRVKYISANVVFEDGGTAILWIPPNVPVDAQIPAPQKPE